MENKTAGHTPGPWEYDWYDGHISLMSEAHPDDYFARIEFSDCVESGEWDGESAPTEEIANARLIAAAPELLSTLRSTEGELMAAYGAAGHSLDSARSMPSVKAIRRIITKIEGK